ncbi:melanocyte-stimulating hormone receptor-like [Oculina patagonica]
MEVNTSMEQNSTNESSENNPNSIPFFNVMMCVFNVPLSLVSILANAVVLTAIWRTPSLHSPAILLLSNLALTDMAVGLLAQPLLIFNHLVKWRSRFAGIYPITRDIYNIMGFWLCGASFFSVTAISVDRTIALKYHLRYNSLVTFKRTGLVIADIWLVSGFVSSMKLWKSSVFYPSIALIIVVCLFTSFIAYFKVYRIVRRHQAQIHAQIQVISVNGENHARLKRLRRSAVNTFYVYSLFLFCYLPYLAVVVTGIFIPNAYGLIKGYGVTATVVNLNSALNPLFYCWHLSEIRRAVKQILAVNSWAACTTAARDQNMTREGTL